MVWTHLGHDHTCLWVQACAPVLFKQTMQWCVTPLTCQGILSTQGWVGLASHQSLRPPAANHRISRRVPQSTHCIVLHVQQAEARPDLGTTSGPSVGWLDGGEVDANVQDTMCVQLFHCLHAGTPVHHWSVLEMVADSGSCCMLRYTLYCADDFSREW